MPFQSEAQRRKFAELVAQGKMKPEVFAEWNAATVGKLPERVTPTAQKPRKRRVWRIKGR